MEPLQAQLERKTQTDTGNGNTEWFCFWWEVSLCGDKPAWRLESGCEAFLAVGKLLCFPRVNTPLVYVYVFYVYCGNYLQHEYTILANF